MKKGEGMLRTAGSAALLLLLAASGYVGARQKDAVQAVSVPVVFEAMEPDEILLLSAGKGENRLQTEREQALGLLEDVIRDPRAAEDTVQNALKQKTDIAAAMEREARLVEALEQMGIKGTRAVSGKQSMMVIAPEESFLDDKKRMQIVDAAATIAGVEAQNVKIILAKNE